MKEAIEELIEKYQAGLRDLNQQEQSEFLDGIRIGTKGKTLDVISDLTNLLKQNQ